MPDDTPKTSSWILPENDGQPFCAQFEAAWKAGLKPQIERFLEGVAESDRSKVVTELLALELELRRAAGDNPVADEYQARFPQYPDVIKFCFADAADAMPTMIGRYQVRRLLGGGGFGHVHLCYDDRAQREVAVKVPRRDRLDSAEARAAFRREARNVARLDHPRIVPLYDIAEEGDHCFLVYKFIPGCSLRERMNQGPIPLVQIAMLIAEVAEILHYAHGKNLFHRDVKPGNILLDRDGQAYVTDFGLAVPEDELPRSRGRQSGTFPYMAPEQIRGEGHRLDGRTDIYSLGVVLYELLCGRRPFAGANTELFEQILHQDVRPPRQIREGIPRELERICLKATAKQMSARYETAHDLAEDLRLAAAALAGASSTSPESSHAPAVGAPQAEGTEISRHSSSRQLSPIMPKGLRSFGAEDREFFLELLPGPRDRDELPDALRFWKTRIESTDPEQTFAVGLLYGPSGCGKSSLLKAGLLPRLAGGVVPVHLEAAPHDTEARLIKALRKACPALPAELPLPEMLARLRRSRDLPDGAKILIVIDQFEQWLHAHGQDMEASLLLATLRHADGVHVQALLLVRDDFWMGTSRLFDLLEINLDRERNTRAVDLFDAVHARRVLGMFGQAFDRLPAHITAWTEDQRAFLDRAVAQLSEDGRIISVRLSLFADLMKDRPWTCASLIEVGGAEGVGLRFLEETFSARTAQPDLRALEKPIRGLLQALLPESGADIKGRLRPRAELAGACALPEHSPRFARLLEILDRELHIITPTEIDQATGEGPAAPQAAYYQLTHDYLVQPLRQWLTQERRKTWRGRAELCLEERTAQWGRAKDKRFLPTAWEYPTIVLGVPRSRRRPEQQILMHAARRHHGIRGTFGLLVLFLIGLAVNFYFIRVRSTAEALVQALLSATAAEVPNAIDQLKAHPGMAPGLLRARFQQAALDPTQRLHAAFGMAAFEEAPRDFLVEGVATARFDECQNLVSALATVKNQVADNLFEQAKDRNHSVTTRIRYALVLLHLGEARASEALLAYGPDPAQRTAFILGLEAWHGDLRTMVQTMQTSGDPALRSGLCAALGRIRAESLDAEERRQVIEQLGELFRKAPDGATHSAAGWALRQWQAPLPDIPSAQVPIPGQHWFVNQVGMTMIEIPFGTFIMGDPDFAKHMRRRVTITNPFFVSNTEVRVDQFQKFVEDANYASAAKPQKWKGVHRKTSPTDDCPIQWVTWHEALLFCNWLSVQEGRDPCYRQRADQTWSCDVAGAGYRLLTEAEWEYACRAGSTTRFSFGDDRELLKEHGYFAGNSALRAWPVASKLPNAFGLFDMHGNVEEWCWDWHASYAGDGDDPWGSLLGSERVIRGGGWHVLDAGLCGSGVRAKRDAAHSQSFGGFRVACLSHR